MHNLIEGLYLSAVEPICRKTGVHLHCFCIVETTFHHNSPQAWLRNLLKTLKNGRKNASCPSVSRKRSNQLSYGPKGNNSQKRLSPYYVASVFGATRSDRARLRGITDETDHESAISNFFAFGGTDARADRDAPASTGVRQRDYNSRMASAGHGSAQVGKAGRQAPRRVHRSHRE